MKLDLRSLLFSTLAVCAVSFTNAQNMQESAVSTDAETAPQFSTKAIFDVEHTYDIGSTGSCGVNGLAGVILFNNQYWVSQWNSARIYILDINGALVVDTTIAGITGTRSFTTDGTDIYIGGGSTVIYKVNPATYTLTSTININTSSNAEARMCTYDATLDNGNGGFWIGDFSSDIASVSMAGQELSVIAAATHGTTMYGGAYDSYSTEGKFLWIHDQTAAGGQDKLVQLDLNNGGTPTGLSFDYTPAVAGGGTTSVLAGGLFITDQINSTGQPSFIGVCQSQPSNLLFSLELVQPANVDETSDLTFEIYPNPATDIVNIKTGLNGVKNVNVFDITGKQVVQTNMLNNELDVSQLTKGIYFVKVSQNGYTHTEKLVIR